MSVGAVNKSTGDRIPTAGMPAIDAALSGSSTNPVQNMVVKAALDEKADTDIVASDFSSAASYTAGNYCIYEGKFYKFKNNHTGAWAAADVDEIKIAGELSSLKSGLTNLENGTKTLLGKLQVNESVQLPATWKRLYMRVNISDYFNGSINVIDGGHILIPFSVSSWACTIDIEISASTVTFASETTIAGTKDSGWTTYVEIYYS